MTIARTRERSPVRLSRCVIVGILASTLPAPAVAVAAAAQRGRMSTAATTPDDRAATHTLLKAKYELTRTTLASTLAIEAAEARAAKALGHECKGVLEGVPDESVIEEEGPLASAPRLSGRAQGERARSEKEKQTIDLEIDETIFAAAYGVVRRPYEVFIAAAERLTWTCCLPEVGAWKKPEKPATDKPCKATSKCCLDRTRNQLSERSSGALQQWRNS
jgi:hypothetical protein